MLLRWKSDSSFHWKDWESSSTYSPSLPPKMLVMTHTDSKQPQSCPITRMSNSFCKFLPSILGPKKGMMMCYLCLQEVPLELWYSTHRLFQWTKENQKQFHVHAGQNVRKETQLNWILMTAIQLRGAEITKKYWSFGLTRWLFVWKHFFNVIFTNLNTEFII